MSLSDLHPATCYTLEEVAQWTLRHARRVTHASLGNVQLIDWTVGYLEIVAHQGFSDEFLPCFRRVSQLDGSACGRALLRGTVAIADVLEDDSFASYRGVAERAGFRAVQSTPLLSSSGALCGVVSTHSMQTGRLTDQQLCALEDVAARAANRIIRLKERGCKPLSHLGGASLISAAIVSARASSPVGAG
jgi:GAF domain-containing protein